MCLLQVTWSHKLEVRGLDVGVQIVCRDRGRTAGEHCGGGLLYNTVLECVCGDY